MTINQFVNLLESVGIPVVVGAAAAWSLWKIITWILKDLLGTITRQHNERGKEQIELKTEMIALLNSLTAQLDEEIRDTRALIKDLQGVNIQVVDRVRVMERNVYRFQDAVRTRFDLPNVDYKLTRKEKYDEAQQIIKDVGKINGD
jgi:glutamine synthetase type III|tara:strand:+ start:467 stop:904 length:438 start_codon:yes stop_codon:yes gene_type:complete